MQKRIERKLKKSGKMETEYNPNTWRDLLRELERSGKLRKADGMVRLYLDELHRGSYKVSSLIGDIFTKIAELSDDAEEAMILGYYIGHSIGHRIGRGM